MQVAQIACALWTTTSTIYHDQPLSFIIVDQIFLTISHYRHWVKPWQTTIWNPGSVIVSQVPLFRIVQPLSWTVFCWSTSRTDASSCTLWWSDCWWLLVLDPLPTICIRMLVWNHIADDYQLPFPSLTMNRFALFILRLPHGYPPNTWYYHGFWLTSTIILINHCWSPSRFRLVMNYH